MKLKKFRQNVGHVVVLFPIPKTGTGVLKDSNNLWIVMKGADDRTFIFKNRFTNHELTLGIEQIDRHEKPNIVVIRVDVTLEDGGKTSFKPASPGIGSGRQSSALSRQPTWNSASVVILVAILIGIFISVFIAYRGNHGERAHFAITEMWPTTSPIWPMVGEPLDMNFRYKNVGNGTALDIVIEGLTLLKPDESKSSQDQVISNFENDLKARELQKGTIIVKDDSRWSTTKRGSVLTAEDRANFVSGEKVIFTIAIIQWRDDYGQHTQRLCRYLQPPKLTPDGRGRAAFGPMGSCHTYNDEVDGWIQPLAKK
jgi:hypothetical protein